MHKEIVKAAIVAASTKFVTLTFKKKCGEVRRINGRFNVTSKTVSGEKVDLAKVVQENNPLIPFWSPREGWKSFRLDNILAVSVSNTKISEG